MAVQTSRSRKSKRILQAAKLAIALTTSSLSLAITGCGSMQVAENTWNYNSTWNGFVMKHRNNGMAVKAWHRRKHHFCNEQHMDAFCDGFKAGYLSVAEGGDGCTPPFAPREYWGWEHQTADGQRKVSSWFAGFPHGCRAAEEDGVGNWTQLQTSYGVQREYHQAGLMAPNQSPGMYPMPEPAPAAKAFLNGEAVIANPAQPGMAAPANAVPTLEAIPADTPPTLQLPQPGLELPTSDRSSQQAPNSRLVR